MRITVSFRVTNDVHIETPMSVSHGQRSLFIERDKERISSVSEVFSSIPASEAPTISSGDKTKIPQINFTDQYSILAERDIRAWQSIIAPFQVIDIDFISPTIKYETESAEEESKVQLKGFTRKVGDHSPIRRQEFSIFGRAFLAAPESYDQIEKMAFFIEGQKLLHANQCIEAYNQFFLFLESNFSLKFRSKNAAQELSSTSEFRNAFKEACEEFSSEELDSLELKGVSKNSQDTERGALSIVELRGHLRHHSLSSPHRWDPHNQETHRLHAVFIAAICQKIAMPVFLKSFDEQYADEFLEQARRANFMQVVNVTATILCPNSPLPQDISFDLNFPTTDASPNLAKAALSNALQVIANNSRECELLGIRAFSQKPKQELFRYDLGPGILRADTTSAD